MEKNKAVSRDRWWLRMCFQVIKESLRRWHLGRDLNKVKKWAVLMSERSFHGGGGTHRANTEVGDALDEERRPVLLGPSARRRWGGTTPRTRQCSIRGGKHVNTTLDSIGSCGKVLRKVTVWCKPYSVLTGCSWRTEQMVQGPEGRLGTQAGVYLVPAASRVSSSQPSCNLF